MDGTAEVNPYARPHACLRCGDSRMLARYPTARKENLDPCDRCGTLNVDEYERFRRDAWVRDHTPPAICELDLTPEEFIVYERMRRDHPAASKLTVLSWLEGQRYDPVRDSSFLEEAREKFKAWRARA
jgi:predicted  nucleic acid-binding Zn-ribbon protein